MTIALAASRITSTKAIAFAMHRPTTARHLSSQGIVAMEKLRDVLEEYRVQNYTREIPSRFKKDIVRAAMLDKSNRIEVDGMKRVLNNINMQHRVSDNEISLIFREMGGETGQIPMDRMINIL